MKRFAMFSLLVVMLGIAAGYAATVTGGPTPTEPVPICRQLVCQ